MTSLNFRLRSKTLLIVSAVLLLILFRIHMYKRSHVLCHMHNYTHTHTYTTDANTNTRQTYHMRLQRTKHKTSYVSMCMVLMSTYTYSITVLYSVTITMIQFEQFACFTYSTTVRLNCHGVAESIHRINLACAWWDVSPPSFSSVLKIHSFFHGTHNRIGLPSGQDGQLFG